MNLDVNTKWYICRICLKGEQKKFYPIFEAIAEEEITDLGTLHDKIEVCGGIKLYQQNNLPTQICNRCILLLRAAYKFRDLCQQSQNQLKEFINIQKQEVDELNNISFDSDADEQHAEAQEEEALLDVHSGYMIEERVDDFDAIVDSQHLENSKDEDEYVPPADQDDEQFEGFSDEEDLQYVVEEVNAKQFVCEDNEEEITTYKYEEDINNDNIIIEEQTRKPQARKIYLSKKNNDGKSSTKRKRKTSDEGPVTYDCSYCDNTYTEKAKYTMHMKIHNKEKQHECEICNKRFSTTPQLSRHMNSHTGNRPYQCKYCDARFGDPSTKIKHERIHTNERPYKCNICDKAFAYSNVLKVHMMTHSGEKPHSCEFCGKSFTQLHHKNAHEKRHTSYNMVIVGNSPDIECMDEESDTLKDYKLGEIVE